MIRRGTYFGRTVALIAGVSGCTGGPSSPHQADSSPSALPSRQISESSPRPQGAASPSATDANPLVGIGDAGSFIWRCNRGRTHVTLLPARATESVRVRVGANLVMDRTVQPGHMTTVRMRPATTARWTVTQATEPATLSAHVSITTRPGHCLVYVPPAVRARLTTASH